MHSDSCTNTDHDITDFVNHRIVKNKKDLEYLEKEYDFYTK